MDKKKSGLSKDISSIFQGIPELKESGPSFEPAKESGASTGRNALIPLQKPFCKFWGRYTPSSRSVLDIGTSSLKWICVEKKKGAYELSGMAYVPLPALADQEKFWNVVTQIIHQIKEEAGGLKASDLVISESTALFTSVPVVKENRQRMTQVLKSELIRRNGNFKGGESLAGFFVSPRPSREKVGALHVTTAQAKIEDLEKWVEVLEGSGLEVARMEGLPFAIERLLKQGPQASSEEVVAALEMGAAHSSLLFYRGGILEYQRKIPVSSQDITKALQRPIIGTEGKIELSPEEAQELKTTAGIPLGEETFKTTLGREVLSSQILGLIRLHLERLVREVEGSINFYLKTYQVRMCHRLVLLGGGAKIPNLVPFLKQGLKMERVELMTPFQKFGLQAPSLDLSNMESTFAPALGLALLETPKLDLRPNKLRQFQRLLIFKRLLNKAAAALLVGFGIVFGFGFFQLQRLEHQFLRANGDFLKSKAAMERFGFLEEERQKLKGQIGLYESVVGLFPPWGYLLRELSSVVTDQIYVDDLKISFEENFWVLHLKGVVLPGGDTVEHSLSSFLVRMEDAKCFDQAEFVSSHRKGDSAEEGIEFELKCRVRVQKINV